jgi:hypothetical protein
LRDPNGGVVGGVEVSLDISAYKHTEESLEEVPQEERSLETPAEVNDPPADRGQASP